MLEIPAPSKMRSLQTWLSGGFLIAMGVLLVSHALTTAVLLERPGETTWGEGACVQVTRRVQQGGPLYADWRVVPHVVAFYGPAAYLPVAYIGRWIHAEPHTLFLIGRCISLASVVGTAALIVWLLRARWNVPPKLAIAMGLVFLTADQVLARIEVSFRPDGPACLLTLLGVALMVPSGRRAFLYSSAVVFLAAFLYKQSAIAGPLVTVLWLLLKGRQRQTAYYAALCLVLFGGGLILLEKVTHGLYFLNTLAVLKGKTTLATVPALFLKVSGQAGVPLVIAVAALTSEWMRRIGDPLTLLFAVSLGLALAGTYRDGSDVYYYMQPLAVACVLAGREMGRWWRRGPNAPGESLALTLALVLATVYYVPLAALRLGEMPASWRTFEYRTESNRERAEFFGRLGTYLNGLNGPILSQFGEMGLYCPRSIMTDTYLFTFMSDAGTFDDHALLAQIQEGRIAAIVLNPQADPMYQSTDTFSRRWLRAMSKRYRPVDVPGLEAARIYRPKGEPQPSPDARTTSQGNRP